MHAFVALTRDRVPLVRAFVVLWCSAGLSYGSVTSLGSICRWASTPAQRRRSTLQRRAGSNRNPLLRCPICCFDKFVGECAIRLRPGPLLLSARLFPSKAICRERVVIKGQYSKDGAMEKYRIHSRHVIDTPFEAEIGWLDRLKERVVDVVIQPVMLVGVALYVLAMWLIEWGGEAVR